MKNHIELSNVVVANICLKCTTLFETDKEFNYTLNVQNMYEIIFKIKCP